MKPLILGLADSMTNTLGNSMRYRSSFSQRKKQNKNTNAHYITFRTSAQMTLITTTYNNHIGYETDAGEWHYSTFTANKHKHQMSLCYTRFWIGERLFFFCYIDYSRSTNIVPYFQQTKIKLSKREKKRKGIH